MALTEADLAPIDKKILEALVRENKPVDEVLKEMASGYRKVADFAEEFGNSDRARIYRIVADDVDVVVLYLAKKDAE